MAYETVNPASGARLKSFDDISEAALESAVATAQRAYQTSWRDRPVAERAQILAKAAALLRERAEAKRRGELELMRNEQDDGGPTETD